MVKMGEATLRTIQRIDAVLDCIPVVSTLTNGAQLLYKAARKVDATANPIAPGRSWKTDLKIHVISKPSGECGFCMIPFVGNIDGLANLIMRIMEGLKDHLISVVCRSNTEVVKLAIANGHLDNTTDHERARRILGQTVYSSNFETFNLIFNSRDWTQSEVIEALPLYPLQVQDKMVNAMLDYYHKNNLGADEPTEYPSHCIIRAFGAYVKANKGELADRILGLLSTGSTYAFEKFSGLLQNAV